ncbi:MAG TPA: flagellar type III secretion system pore protein FliP [Anaerolineaceae bacterium]|nr:flagellar type III secretion system pore protein FliP [Anaerolineaceae bacterium]
MKTRLPSRKLLAILLLGLVLIGLTGCAANPELAAPGVTLSVQPDGQPEQVTTGVQLLVLLTVLSLAPAILVLATSFTRIVIVLSMVRNAIGTPTIPPNQVIIGLSLLLTFFIMAPVYDKVNETAIQPYLNQEIDQDVAFERAVDPVREFMFNQTREKDIQLFLELSGKPQPQTLADIDTVTLFPAFVISELRTAFTMGFLIYIPFLVIDLVISSILLSMGMMMLPPSLVSLPFKILLFILVDGWYLITRSLTLSFFT